MIKRNELDDLIDEMMTCKFLSAKELNDLLIDYYNGDDSVEQRIIEGYYQRIYNVCVNNQVSDQDLGSYINDTILYIYKLLKDNRDKGEEPLKHLNIQQNINRYIKSKIRNKNRDISLEQLAEASINTNQLLDDMGRVVVTSNEDIVGRTETNEVIEKIRQILNNDLLTAKEKETIVRRYFNGNTLAEIALDENVSRSLIGQRENNAIHKIKGTLIDKNGDLNSKDRIDRMTKTGVFSEQFPDDMYIDMLKSSFAGFNFHLSRIGNDGTYYFIYANGDEKNRGEADSKALKYLNDQIGTHNLRNKIAVALAEYKKRELPGSGLGMRYSTAINDARMYITGDNKDSVIVITRENSDKAYELFREKWIAQQKEKANRL